ncbi:hypothetical protein LXL04_016318 [Taraxacum kok-saghyz]
MKQKEHIKTRKCFGFPKCFEIDSQIHQFLKGSIHGRKNRMHTRNHSWQKKSFMAEKIEHRRLKKAFMADSKNRASQTQENIVHGRKSSRFIKSTQIQERIHGRSTQIQEIIQKIGTYLDRRLCSSAGSKSRFKEQILRLGARAAMEEAAMEERESSSCVIFPEVASVKE